MRSFELTYPHTLNLEEIPESVCAIGFFDGIHKGHQQVIGKAVEEAKSRALESAVITFHPHPSVVLKKDTQHVQYITPIKEKQEFLANLGVDRLYIITFNKELSQLSPQKFIDHFIIGLNIKHLVAGFDYSFGFKGQGNMANIHEFTRGAFSYSVIDEVSLNEEKISSTKIRNLLKEGNVEETKKLLGRPLTYKSIVIPGANRGNNLGYPTANLQIVEEALLPKIGIYAVHIIYKNAVYEGMASIGTNPTFKEDKGALSVEVNIFDYNNDLYGEELEIAWQGFIREEEKYDNVDDLIAQLAEDEKNIRSFLKQLS